jgi:hypothetical protein
MEAFLRALLPRLLPGRVTFDIYPHQGKEDLLGRLPARLKAYAGWLPEAWCIVVVVDRDDDDCKPLKNRIEKAAADVGLGTRSTAGPRNWRLVNRIAVEELEAWYFGDWEAVRKAYPRVSRTIPNRESYRNPDAIRGGTWEAFANVLRRAGYFTGGLRKLEVARALGNSLDPFHNRSRSFQVFREALLEVVESA